MDITLTKKGTPRRRRTSEQARTWGAPRLQKSTGYIRLTRTVDGKAEFETEHRLVMQEVLKRPLLPGENVHHKNGNKVDNRPENLELWITSQPAGQRPEDLVTWAREVIELYAHLT